MTMSSCPMAELTIWGKRGTKISPVAINHGTVLLCWGMSEKRIKLQPVYLKLAVYPQEGPEIKSVLLALLNESLISLYIGVSIWST